MPATPYITSRQYYHQGTVRTRINDPCARTLDLPLSVRSGVFFFFFWLSGQIFGVFFAPFPEEEISDYIAQGSFIRVLTVIQLTTS